MAYLHSSETIIQTLNRQDEIPSLTDEIKEYLNLRDVKESDPNSIPTFSFSLSSQSSNYLSYIAKQISSVLPSIFDQKICSKERAFQCLKLLLPSNQKDLPTEEWPRIIKFNQFDFNLAFKKSKSILFSEKYYKPFRFGPHYFEFRKYIEFLDGTLYLTSIFNKLVLHSEVIECILSIDSISDFLDEIIDETSHLKQMFENKSAALPFYKQFFLEQVAFRFDPYGLNKISAIDLILSNHFSSFFEISYLAQKYPEDDVNDNNPYSYATFQPIFAAFSSNVNSEGLLDKESFKHIKEWHFCDCFIDRVYENSEVYDDCLDFRGFCIFYISYDNCDTKNGARYIFNLLDIDGDGLVTPLDLSYFYKDLVKESKSNETDFDVVVQEILDQTQAFGMGFTLDEFINCGASGEIASIMSDYSEFGIYFGHDTQA